MNERLVLVSANRILNENMMMHDQSKMFTNEFYHGEARYGIDDGMIDELMISGSESLADLTHLENTLNKASNLSANLIPITSEDYFNQFAYNQVSNLMMNNNNTNNNQNNLSNTNQYTYHTLQSPQIPNNSNYNNQLTPTNSSMNSYMSLGPTTTSYGSKIMNRTPSFNSSLCGSSSSSSSPSSLLSSSTSSLNNIPQSSNTQNPVSSSTNESFDYDNASSSGTPNGAANDPAEMARQKQMRGLTLTAEETQLLAKDRQRKDNHNMIERRRRFNINDRIKELGQLLPKNGEYDAKQNKGSILKASVDYILKIKSENDDFKKLQETNKYLITLNKKLYNRIKELEMLCRSNGIQLLNQQNNNVNNNNNYLILNSKTDNHQMNLQSVDNLKEINQMNENFNSFTAYNHNGNHIGELSDNKNNYNESKLEDNVNIPVDACLPSILIYNENASFQTNNTNNEINNANFNQSNQPMTVKKSKNESKKRVHSINGESSNHEFNPKIHQKNNKSELNSKEVKLLKEEPISPKNTSQPTTQILSKPLEQSIIENTNYDSQSFEQTDNAITKYPKLQTFQNNPRFIITTKLIHRPDSKTLFNPEQKDSIQSTLTSSSKDPTLASSSISSPSSPSSSSPSSSNSSSLCQS